MVTSVKKNCKMHDKKGVIYIKVKNILISFAHAL